MASYRPDVDGLRAVAVLSVLVYHAFPAALPGGFAGVDIFFVISGYLISRIILGDLRAGTFTFGDFYSRRIKRIFPALALVLLTCLIVGWWGLLPADFRQLGAHVAAGAGFVSNILLWSEAGYFDTAAELKPLLHLWSLGVEEQYYLVWPLTLFLFRRHVHSIFWVILAVAVGSFVLNVVATMRVPDAAFYLPPTRFWELMIGSVIAYAQIFRAPNAKSAAPWRGSSNLLSAGGAVFLVATFVFLHEDRAFPGWWALLPTLGAALLICAGPEAWLNRLVLSNRAAVYIGLISYPLYLWHWPLLTYARIFNEGEPPPTGVRVLVLLLSAVLSWLTYEFVEKKVRRSRAVAWYPRVVPALAASIAALGLYGLLAFGSISQARSAQVPRLAAVSEAFDDWEYEGDARVEGDSPRTVLFFGDSHMQQYLPRIEALMEERPAPVRSVIYKTRNGCAPIPGIERRGRECDDFVAEGLGAARHRDVEIVVFGASWVGFTDRTDYYRSGEEYTGKPLRLLTPETQWVLDGFEAELRSLVKAGKKVVIVLSSPRGPAFDPREMVKKDGLEFDVEIDPSVPRTDVVAQNAFIDERLEAMARRSGAIVVSPLDALCTETACPTVDATGSPLFMDASHVRSTVVRRRFHVLDEFVFLEPPADRATAHADSPRHSAATAP